MGMCAMYSFCKYGPMPVEHEEADDSDDSSRSKSSRSSRSRSDGRSMLPGSKRKEPHLAGGDQQSALWKRAIPKGRRCEQLEFSGLILYDEHGNRLHPFRRSDRPSQGSQQRNLQGLL